MISCIDRYQQLLPALNRSSSRVGSALQESDRDAIRAYLDLSNEELFYFKARYLPRAVAIEWTEGILAVLESKKDAWSTEIAGYPRLAALLEAASESNEADSGRLAKAALLAN